MAKVGVCCKNMIASCSIRTAVILCCLHTAHLPACFGNSLLFILCMIASVHDAVTCLRAACTSATRLSREVRAMAMVTTA
jgi:hypothetical protein